MGEVGKSWAGIIIDAYTVDGRWRNQVGIVAGGTDELGFSCQSIKSDIHATILPLGLTTPSSHMGSRA